MVVVYKRTSGLMNGCICALNLLHIKQCLFVSLCFLSLANLYEEDLYGLTGEEVWKLVLDYKRTAVHLISV